MEKERLDMNQNNPFGSPGQAPAFSGLDDAQAFGPELNAGTTWYEVDHCEAFDQQFGLTFVAHVKVLASDNPDNVPGKIYRLKRGGLTKNQYQEANMAKLKTWLASMLGVDPAQPPSPGETWQQVAMASVQNDGTALRGCRGKVIGTPARSKEQREYVKWKYLPYTNPNAGA